LSNPLSVVVPCHRLIGANGIGFEWRGVDKIRIKDGRIAEERVHSDTAPLRAFRSGEKLEPITTL
jgi:6-O-methylguanine DNA methyltransferase, DNA binding domain